MAITIDLIAIGIIVLSTFLGYKKGLIGVAFKILSFIIAIIITLILYKPVANLIINNTGLAKTIESTITEKLSSEKIEEGKIEQNNTNLPKVIVKYINGEIANTVNNTKDSVVQIIAKEITNTVINVIVMIGIFLVVRITLLFAKTILEAVAELPLIKQFNETGGIIYGILRGIILIYTILTIISLILPMLDKKTVLDIINNTIITKILYNNNIILMFFFK